MSNVIDLSAARPATRNAIGEAAHDAQLQKSALAQMLSLLNMSKPQMPPLHLAAIEHLQMEGIAVGVEFLAQKCGGEENEWVKLIRTQIVEENARRVSAAEAAAAAPNAASPTEAPGSSAEAVDGNLHVSIGYAPVATAENAGAIRSALLAGFVQLSQQFPDSVIEPTIARVALQWIPTEESADDEPGEEAREIIPA
jgi:hypothetical protein